MPVGPPQERAEEAARTASLEPQVRLPEGEGRSGNDGLESPEWSFSQAHKGVVGLLMPILEMRKLELRDVESRDHSHRAGPLGSGDLE